MSDVLATAQLPNAAPINVLIKGYEFNYDEPWEFERNRPICEYNCKYSTKTQHIDNDMKVSSGGVSNYALCIIGSPINPTTGLDANIVNIKGITKGGSVTDSIRVSLTEEITRNEGESYLCPIHFVNFMSNLKTFNYEGNTPDPIEIKNILYFENETYFNSFKNALEFGGVFNPEFIANWGEGPEPEPEPEPEDKDGEIEKQDKGYYFQSVQTKYGGKSGQTYTELVSQYFERYEFDPTTRRICFYPTVDSLGSANKKFNLKNAGGLPCRAKIGKVSSEWREDYRYISQSKPIYLTGDYKLSDGSYMVSSFSTNIPIFRNEGDADDYVEIGDNVDEAINADSVTDGGIVSNKKPSGDDVTIDFQSFADLDKMINYYTLSKSQMNALSNALWNADATEIEEATKLIGSNAFNAIASCRYFPMDISKVCSFGPSQNIHLGKFDTEVSATTIKANSGTKNFGSYYFAPIHNSFLDYSNVKISIWLPYIGLNELDPHKYMGKTATLDYFVDITSGACQAVMTVGGAVVDSWAGELGRQVPITAEDAQSYNDGIRNAVINVRNFNTDYQATQRNQGFEVAKSAVGGVGQIVKGNVVGAMESGISDIQNAFNYEDTLTKLERQASVLNQQSVNASQNMPTMVCGTAGGFISQRMPQSVYLFFTVNKSIEPQYTRELVGKPTSASGPVSMFSGFIAGDVVKVQGYMTEEERTMIAQLLKGGIYV